MSPGQPLTNLWLLYSYSMSRDIFSPGLFSPMSTNSTCSAPLPANTDISGIGVRTSFYLQTFLLGL